MQSGSMSSRCCPHLSIEIARRVRIVLVRIPSRSESPVPVLDDGAPVLNYWASRPRRRCCAYDPDHHNDHRSDNEHDNEQIEHGRYVGDHRETSSRVIDSCDIRTLRTQPSTTQNL